MTAILAGRTSEFGDGTRRLVSVDGVEVVVYRLGEGYHAFENTCLHMGGPVAEGRMMGRVRAVLDERKRVVREEFRDDEMQLVCPWHGWAYDAATGEFAGDPSLRLRAFQVEVRGDAVYVVGS